MKPKSLDPLASALVIRTDGSFESNLQISGIGWTLNENNVILAAGASPLQCSSIIEAEAMALLAGLMEAERRKLSNFINFTDSIYLRHSELPK